MVHALLLCALVRALVPVGYMPDLSAARDGTFKVVICTGDGARTITLDASGAPTHPADTAGDQQGCVFSTLAEAVISPAAGPAVAVPAGQGLGALRPAPSDVLPVRMPAGYGARAPPLFS